MNRLRGGARHEGSSGEVLGRRGGLRRRGLALVGAGALVVAVAAPAMAVGPGDLGPGEDEQFGGWDLVASRDCLPTDTVCIADEVALNVDNASGWSYEAETETGYAVLDPLNEEGTEESTIGLVTRDQTGPLASFTASVTLRTADDGTHGPRLRLRVPLPTAADCRLIYFFPDSVPAWDTFNLTPVPPEAQRGHWVSQRCDPDDQSANILDGPTWSDVLAAFPGASIENGLGLPGVNIETGDPDATADYSTAHVDSATINGTEFDFQAPTLTLQGDAPAPINPGESVEVTLTGTLSGPNQATIYNEINFLTGPGGLDSGGTFGQTDGTEGLCTVEPAEPTVMFPPDRALPTRPFGDGVLSVVELGPETVTVTVTALEENPGGVGVFQGGTCVIGIVDPLNALPAGGVTIEVNAADDTRPALALPDEVPADTGALTVTPACAVEGDTLTVTAPAGSFAPESEVSLGLYDSGIDLGVTTAEPDGSLSIEGPLPAGVPNGTQTLLAVGYASTDNDDPANLSAEFEVGCPAGTGGGSGGVPSGIPAGVGGLDDGNGFLATGAAMLLALGGYLARRRWTRA